jgi:hypothetical protein
MWWHYIVGHNKRTTWFHLQLWQHVTYPFDGSKDGFDIIYCYCKISKVCSQTVWNSLMGFMWIGKMDHNSLLASSLLGKPTLIVTTLILRACEGEDSHSRNGSLGVHWNSRNFREWLRGWKNTSHWGVFYIIGKQLKFRCPKWACMTHFDICNTSHGKKKSHSDVGAAERHRKYYMGEGGGFPQA